MRIWGQASEFALIVLQEPRCRILPCIGPRAVLPHPAGRWTYSYTALGTR